jgi:hypothetical protein
MPRRYHIPLPRNFALLSQYFYLGIMERSTEKWIEEFEVQAMSSKIE